jgi:hypothetical protein
MSLVQPMVGTFRMVLPLVTDRSGEAQNETSDRSHASELSAEPADQVRACGGVAFTRICDARKERTEDGEATAHASGRWANRKGVLAGIRAWDEGGSYFPRASGRPL